MTTTVQIINFVALLIGLFGFLFFFYALWNIMKSTKSIEKTVKLIEQKIK
jgi:phage shock protein PspC (stress-responsive transcriptional regulator)